MYQRSHAIERLKDKWAHICRLRGHDWTEWAYWSFAVPPELERIVTLKTRVCKRCTHIAVTNAETNEPWESQVQ